MNEQELNELKTEYIECVIKNFKRHGSLVSELSFFGHDKASGKQSKIMAPIPESYLKDGRTKNEFIQVAIPMIAKEIKKDFDICAIGFSSEAYLQTINSLEEYQNDLSQPPTKKEVIIISLETNDSTYTTLFEIKRIGSAINNEGKLTDDVDLIPMDKSHYFKGDFELSGRFSSLMKYFA